MLIIPTMLFSIAYTSFMQHIGTKAWKWSLFEKCKL